MTADPIADLITLALARWQALHGEVTMAAIDDLGRAIVGEPWIEYLPPDPRDPRTFIRA